MTGSTLLPILGIPFKFTTTSCSKVPQGLRFPLDVCGLCTTGYFQRALIWDSDNLVKPFMQVAIQTTRYYAQICYIQEINFSKVNDFSLTLNIAIQFGLYLNHQFISTISGI